MRGKNTCSHKWSKGTWSNNTRARVIRANELGMHHVENRVIKRVPLAILSRILAQPCVTLCLNGGVTRDCASILDSLLVPTIFCMVHPYMYTPFIHLNDFCTCYTCTFVGFTIKRSYMYVHV